MRVGGRAWRSAVSLRGGGGWAAPDFRGHGGSFIPERIPSWRVFVDDVMAWQKAAHFHRPLAVGHSLGGVTALTGLAIALLGTKYRR